MNATKRWTWLSSFALLTATLSCGGERAFGPRFELPTTRTLELVLAPTTSDVGAVLVSIRGPDLTETATPLSDYQAFVRGESGSDGAPSSVTLAVVGARISGALLTLELSQAHDLASYTVTVLQVADATNALRDDVAAYSVSVRPAAPQTGARAGDVKAGDVMK